MRLLDKCLTKLPQRGPHESLILKAIVLVCLVSTVVCTEEVTSVRRRLKDIYYYESTHINCDDHNCTYLVDERRCVNNRVFSNGKSSI